MYNPILESKKFLTTRKVFTITILIIILTIISIWLFGLGQHRTIFINSILSTSLLSITFFLFISTGLYKGIKLKDDIGKISVKPKFGKFPELPDGLEAVPNFFEIGEGILISIIGWILTSLLLIIFIWLFGTILWSGILVFITMLYWIFFRALRLVFKNSNRCRADFLKSITYGFGYTILYNFWIYGIILVSHYLI